MVSRFSSMKKSRNQWKKISKIHLNTSVWSKTQMSKLNLTHCPKSEPMKWKTSLKIKTWRKRESKEFGTKPKRITSGKKINKIKCPNKKRVKKHINSGRKNQNFRFLKSERLRIKEKPAWPSRTGFKGENSDTDGKKLKKLEPREEDSILRIIRQRLSKKDSKPNLFKRHQRAKVAQKADQKGSRVAQKVVQRQERVKEDDILIVFSWKIFTKRWKLLQKINEDHWPEINTNE